MLPPFWHCVRFIGIALVVGILAAVTLLPLQADGPKISAYDTPFSTSIVYLNASNETANFTFDYFPSTRPRISSTATPLPRTPIPGIHQTTLAPLASRSLTVERLLQRSNNYQGSGIAISDAPLRTTLVFVPQNTTNVGTQMLATGYTGEGANTYYIPAISKGMWGFNSIVAVQNVSLLTATVTLEIYNNLGVAQTPNYTIPGVVSGSSVYFDIARLRTGGDFSGSAIVTASQNINVTVAELSEDDTYANMFEGAIPATNIYLPSLPCQLYGATGHLAVRNTSGTPTSLTLQFYNQQGTPVAIGSATPIALGGNAKVSINGCAFAPTGFNGSVKLISSSKPIVAVAKVKVEGMYQAAYTGLTTPGCLLTFPFVRWASDSNWGSGALHSRTYLAIQNVGAEIEGNVTITYLGKDGEFVTSHTIGGMQPNEKVNSNPTLGEPEVNEFGYYPGHVYGGSVIIQGPEDEDVELLAIARVSRNIGPLPAPSTTPTPVILSEDYHAIADAGTMCALGIPTPTP